MNHRSARSLLGLEDGTTLTRTALRRVYLRRLRDFPPERDPDGFRELRAAFDLLRRTAPDDPEPVASEPADAIVLPATRVVEAVAEVARAVAAPPIGEPPVETPRQDPEPVLAGEPFVPLEPLKLEPVPAPAAPPKPVSEPPEVVPPTGEPPEPPTGEAPEPPRRAPVAPPAGEPPKVVDSPFDDGLRPPLPPLAAVPVPAAPPPSLPELVKRLLALLETGDVTAAVELATWWRSQTYADDFREAGSAIAIRWALTRELLEIAPQLPKPVTRALARALVVDELATARPALDAFRIADPKAAGEANVLLATRATSLYEEIKGTLYIPKPVPMSVLFPGGGKLPPLPVPQPRRSAGGGAAAVVIGMLLMAIMAGVRTGSSGHSTYEPKLPKFDPHLFDPIQIPPIDFSSWFAPPPWPKLMLTTDSHGDLWRQLDESAEVLQKFEITSPAQKSAAGAFAALLPAEKCPALRKAFETLVAEPPIDKPDRVIYAQQHLDAIRDRLDVLCAKPPAKRPKPEKTR